jgi:hypothetical protein
LSQGQHGKFVNRNKYTGKVLLGPFPALKCQIHVNSTLIVDWKALEENLYLEGTLISINFSPRKWEGYYAYSSIVGGSLHL